MYWCVFEIIGIIMMDDYFVIGGIGILLGGYLYGILVFIVIWYDGIRDGCIVCIIMIIELFLLFIICLFNVDLYVEFGNIIFWV